MMLNLSLVLGVQNYYGSVAISNDGQTLVGNTVLSILSTLYFHNKISIKYVEIPKDAFSAYEAINNGTIDIFYRRYSFTLVDHSYHGFSTVGYLGVISAAQCILLHKSVMSGVQPNQIVRIAARSLELSELGLLCSLITLILLWVMHKALSVYVTSTSNYLVERLFYYIELTKSSNWYNDLWKKVFKVMVILTSFFLILPMSYLIGQLYDPREPIRIKDVQAIKDSKIEKIFVNADFCSYVFQEKFPPESVIGKLVSPDQGMERDMASMIKSRPGTSGFLASDYLAHLLRYEFCSAKPGHCSSVSLTQSSGLFDGLTTLIYRKSVDKKTHDFLGRYSFSMQENGFWKAVEFKLKESNRIIYKAHTLMKNSEWKPVSWKPITFEFIATILKIHIVSCSVAFFICMAFENYLPGYIYRVYNSVQPTFN